ncbi:3-phenylpropionate/trans-cinnamate dioxygenase ferredoxin subunit [Amycolatopsis xylanica]|uniref:3-phenylpropionate/trans-cinnamate dioxygenase ferredoxin subunit n=1 Tax=Amycolatopsis xylanica TaxID=589385 RepID=A0A1H3E7V1_9PSEU|nr:bifunctional 3-phenylpropionate/cinnamic acid dioxygenase ferredoxin subunit [Amycolatopsis xylanica]SDX74680.1 3-phenylpropionate/trans-cinnamate dioxygenase ferredoxin subunit [Amycolatopsis xylanica]
MIRACDVSDLPDGEAIRIVAHVPISVFHSEGEFFAIDDTCTHQDASLADGWVEGCVVECPLHAATFDLRSGKALCLPANDPVRTYPVVVSDGVIYVDTGVQTGVA